MAEYSFVTDWEFEAPIESVWYEISHPELWPSWWKYVKSAREIEPGDKNGVGSLWEYSWSTKLLYLMLRRQL